MRNRFRTLGWAAVHTAAHAAARTGALATARSASFTVALIGALALLPGGAQAQDPWPNKPISLVVPYPPGGTSDVIGRQLAQRLREELGQTVIVENKAGAATAIGATFVARAHKDGYTLLLSAGSTFTVNPNFNDKLP